ncbi:hypothetical protein BGZ63DRAFT_423698 [Mariannaea sp. PMI_226]|nr:hypothetical protein BGZ63DRAFT_423698 [Mariannaea sp. PMI_226]
MATKEKKEKKSKKASKPEVTPEDNEQVMENTEVPEETEESNEATTEPTSSGKRKADLDEIEVDVNLPEPPSKRARRALKKGKALPSKQDSDDENRSGEQKDKKDNGRSEHGVWIGNLPFYVTPQELRKWLVDNSGEVISDEMITRVKLPKNKDSGRDKGAKPTNKGFAYVDFTDIGPKVAAIALSETELTGRKLLIKDAKSFEGRPKKEPEPVEAGAEHKDRKEQVDPNASRKIFVGNMSFKTTEEDLHRQFEKCGEIEWIKVATFEDTGKCKGYGWVKFKDPEAAAWAVKGFVKIKEEVETEQDFKEDDDNDDEKEESRQKQFKTRKWWVNRLLGRELKLELAEDDQVRYKKRFGKDRKVADENQNPRNRPPPRKFNERSTGGEASGGDAAKPLKTAADISVARLTGAVVEHTGTKMTLGKALAEVDSSSVEFAVRFVPFQESPDFPATVDDRFERALEHQHGNNREAQRLFQTYMASLAEPLGVPMNFVGPTGNTFNAHRIIQTVQQRRGSDEANRLVDALFRLYFGEGKHPAADGSLVEACVEAGIPEEEARKLVSDGDEGAAEVKEEIRRVSMDTDAVPVIQMEGKRRDLTLTGLKEVAAYVKALETIIKESK